MEIVLDWPGPRPTSVDPAYREEVRRTVRRLTRLMTCREHGRGAEVSLDPHAPPGEVGLRVAACCHTFLRQVKWKVEGL
jgi:hypothetical protein